jgi:hypothetical protein
MKHNHLVLLFFNCATYKSFLTTNDLGFVIIIGFELFYNGCLLIGCDKFSLFTLLILGFLVILVRSAAEFNLVIRLVESIVVLQRDMDSLDLLVLISLLTLGELDCF